MTESGCAEMSVRLSAWIDGELDASTTAEVREHIRGCTSCQRRHALLTAARAAVRHLPVETVSAGFDDSFRRRLASSRRAGEDTRPERITTITAAALAAVLVVALLGSVALRRVPELAEAPAARPIEVPLGAASGAPPTGEPSLDTPCASALTCGTAPRADAPCASAATCGAFGLGSRTREGS
jgi:anti-sigma factor RsiW